MATERKHLFKMKDAAKALTNELENLTRGHGSRKEVTEAFVELGTVAKDFIGTDAGRELRAEVEKAGRALAEERAKDGVG